MTDLSEIRALRQGGRHEEARQLLLQLTTRFPEDPIIQYETACVHDFLGQERAAIPHYQAAIHNGLSGEKLRSAYLGLGSTYRALGQYAEAEQTLLEGLERFPEANEIKTFLAMARYNLGEYCDAVSLLLELIVETTSDPDIKGYERAIRLYAQDLDQRWD